MKKEWFGKCPYCSYQTSYKEAKKGEETYCPNCYKHIIFTMTISPKKCRQWEKPQYA